MIIRTGEDLDQTKAVIEVDGETIEDCSGFSYSSDVLSVGDPFSTAVANPRQRWKGKLAPGSEITLKLSNPRVNSGTPTLKHSGRIIEREATSDGSGTRIQLNCADKGWHLANCCGPLKYNLQRGKFIDLFNDGYLDKHNRRQPGLLDRSWGLQGEVDARGIWWATVLTSNYPTMYTRLGKSTPLDLSKATIRVTKGQASATNLAGINRPVFVIAVDAGDRVWDILSEYSRRFNLLVNVSCDGYIQIFNPDYTRPPMYEIEYHDDENRSRNNVESVSLRDNLSGHWTEVTCVGEIVGLEFATLNPEDPFAGRVYGTFSKPDILPFLHRNTFCDGEQFAKDLAVSQAEWRYKRDLFDTFCYEVTVAKHHQNGVWWEAGFMCAVNDSVTGVQGNYYISSVRYERTAAGDVTHVALRLPNLLSASFGVLPAPPNVGYSKGLTRAVTSS